MPKSGATLSVLIVLAVVQAARAAPPAVESAESTVRLGLTAGYDGYQEDIHPQDTEAGPAVGFTAGLSALRPGELGSIGWPDFYAGVTDSFSSGLLHYKGYLDDAGSTPYSAREHGFYNTAIVRLGFGRPMLGGGELIPYVAGGYQNWYRNIGGPAGYGEYYQSGLMGAGLKLDLAPSPLLVVSADAEGFAMIGGSISVPSQNFTGDFGATAEERVSLDADYRLNSSWHAFAGLGLTHYGYSGSKPNGVGLYEPMSTILQVNSIFGLAYGF